MKWCDDDKFSKGAARYSSDAPSRKPAWYDAPSRRLFVFTPDDEKVEYSLSTAEDRLLAYVDAYGRLPPESLESERLMEDFERQVALLPREKKRALHRGFTVKQARLFLYLEENDAKRAVARMAKYWESRVQQLGEDAFSIRYMAPRSEEDFRRVYEISLKAVADPEVDKETKCWAINFSREWDRANIIRLDEELQAISLVDKMAYAEALKTKPEVVATDEHKLMFLRSTDFHPGRAAEKIVKYWETKFRLFGSNVFVEYTARQLMKDHPNEASLGFVQRAPGTDSSGRAIITFSMRRLIEAEDDEEHYSLEGMLKVIWYLLHTVMEDEQCRKNGFIQLNVLKGIYRPTGWRASNGLFDLLCCLPMKFGALHGCGPPSRIHKIVMPVVKWIIGRRMRMRHFSHTGTDEEVVLELREFGISDDQILTDLGGSMDIVARNNAWLEERIAAGT